MNRRIEIDARGLEPPMPMVRILEACAALPRDGEIIARTDRRPVFLLDELLQRGLTGVCQATHDGRSFVTHIQHVEVQASPSA